MIIIFLLYLYNTTISLFVFKKANMKMSITQVTTNKSFTILVPCHNEEYVIYDTLNSLSNLQYDKTNFDIFVILDNCTDNTEYEVKRFIEENNINNINIIPVLGGSKPEALNKAISHLNYINKWNRDNIVIIDADNRVSPTLLQSFNIHHTKYKILQARIVSLNDTNFIAKGFTSSFNTMSESFQYARNQINLSATLCGTGFSIDREVWDEVDFTNCTSLAEDLEFSILANMKGYKTYFVKEEYVLNQNLEEFKPSIIQRLRWSRGYMQVSVNLTIKIIKQFIKKPSLQLFDSLILINTPSKSLLYTISNIYLLTKHTYIISNWIVMILLIYNIIFILYCNKFKLKYILPHIFFSICTSYIILYSVFTWKNTTWKKTEHKKIKEID